MTVPTPASLLGIRGEFGGTAATPLSAYLRGGGFVPIQTLGGIPTALPINVGAFAGAVFPASMSFTGVSNSLGYTHSTTVVAPDLSTATLVLTRTKVVNGGSVFNEIGVLAVNFLINGAVNPNVIVRVPATQPRDVNGYWKLISNSDVKQVLLPAGFAPAQRYATFEDVWQIVDDTGPYQGQFRINTLAVPGNGAAPPQYAAPAPGGVFSLRLTMVENMNIGTATPPGSSMVWNTRNGTNTFVEFPIIIDVYDGGLLRASYPMLLHVEFNAITTFNPS